MTKCVCFPRLSSRQPLNHMQNIRCPTVLTMGGWLGEGSVNDSKLFFPFFISKDTLNSCPIIQVQAARSIFYWGTGSSQFGVLFPPKRVFYFGLFGTTAWKISVRAFMTHTAASHRGGDWDALASCSEQFRLIHFFFFYSPKDLIFFSVI